MDVMPTSTTIECRKLLLIRCLTAIALSMAMQFILLAVFLLLINFHIFHPIEWIKSTLGIMCSLSTWFSIIPLMSAVIIYGIILGKMQLAEKLYCATRFNWLVHNIFRKITFLLAHMLVGFVTAWLYARYLQIDYRNFIGKCFQRDCVNSYYTFLICTGVFSGCYHFFRTHMRHVATFEFSSSMELRLVEMRSLLYSTLYQSCVKSFIPTMIFAVAFFVFGSYINRRLSRIFAVDFDLRLDDLFSFATNTRLLFYAWILNSQILSNMHLMQRFYSLLLAEELQFSIKKYALFCDNKSEVTLVEALGASEVFVIQCLAARDLYNIAISSSATRRQQIFELSEPGNHPFNWTMLVGQCLTLINGFTDELASSVKRISTMKNPVIYASKIKSNAIAEKILLRQYNRVHGIRSMISPPQKTYHNYKTNEAVENDEYNESDECDESFINEPITNVCQRLNTRCEEISQQIEVLFFNFLRRIPGIYYMFGEPDGAKTTFLLSNSEHIALLVQGLSGICAASLLEDKYGVVQVELPEIIKALLKLKYELDKLNNVNLNGKKLDRNFNALKNAVKRGLFMICNPFGEYMREMITEQPELRQLQCFTCYQEC